MLINQICCHYSEIFTTTFTYIRQFDCRSILIIGRKVRPAQSNLPANSREKLVFLQKVPQKITVLTCKDKGENVR